MVVCSWLVFCFLSRVYQVGVYFLALCFRGFFPCVLVDFPGLGAADLVWSGVRLLSRCSFHSGGGECLQTGGISSHYYHVREDLGVPSFTDHIGSLRVSIQSWLMSTH